MSVQKLKNRLKGLEAEFFRQGGRIPEEERVLVVSGRSSGPEEKVNKEFEIRIAELREQYWNFDDTEVKCVHIIDHFRTEDFENNDFLRK